MSNSWGNKRVTLMGDQRAFHQADPWVRKILNYASCPFSAAHLDYHYAQLVQKKGVAQARRTVFEHVQRVGREDMLAAYGPSHPAVMS